MSRLAARATCFVAARPGILTHPRRASHLARGAAPRLAVFLCAMFLATTSVAQDYGFELPAMLMEAWVEPDGTLTLESTFDLRNGADARALDGVDVGMPSKAWSLGRVRAWMDDAEMRDIQKSPYVDNGIAVNLPDGGIAPGGQALVRVRAEGVGSLLFSDTSAEDRVSLRFTPTWFDARYVRGQTFVRVVAHLPPSVPVDGLTWHAVPWTGQVQVEATPERPAHAAVVWERTYPFTSAWTLGVSFPHHVTDAAGVAQPTVAGVREITTWDLFQSWAGAVRVITSLVFIAVFSLIFFWATRRTGCVIWAIVSVVMFVAFMIIPVLPILLAPALPMLAWGVKASRLRAKRAYVPAVASVEGGGIKRGLTAPEAAALLEAKPEKILLLVLYGLSRKGFALLEPKGEKGLAARAADGFGLGAQADVKLAADKGSVLHPYESAFLSLLKGAVLMDVAAIDWRKALRGVAEHAASRLQGYDLKQTKEYYQQIVARAWKEAGSLGDVTLRKEAVDRTFDWLVLDDNAYGRMDGWHRSGWHYRNPWLPGPGARTVPGGVALPHSGGAAPPPLPGAKASDVAGSMGGRLEALSGSFASSLGLGGAKGVFSGVDTVSGDAFKSILTEMSKGQGGGGGSSGGGFSCACACAGCACACACAGGGR